MSQPVNQPTSSSSDPVIVGSLKPIYLVQSLGEYAQMPDGSTINIGGTSNPTFLVNGKALLFADGTSTDGSIGASPTITLQSAYTNSTSPALITTVAGKNITLQSTSGKVFSFNADTGDVTISGNLVVLGSTQETINQAINSDRIQIHQSAGGYTPFIMEPIAGVTPTVNVVDIKVANGGVSAFSIGPDGTVNIPNLNVGLVDGVDIAALKAKVDAHTDLTSTTIDHTAAQVSVDTTGLAFAGVTVQQAISNISSTITQLASSEVRCFEFVQATPLEVWTIVHSQNTKRITINVWDNTDELVYADTITISDVNTVTVTFNTALAGRAILMLF